MSRLLTTTPFQLLQAERGTIRKSHRGKLKLALIYPNTYAIGMSNLAVHTLYRLFNAHPNIVCERFFYIPGYTGIPRSLESGTALTAFDTIACSLSFELDELNLVALLRQANIPIFRIERSKRYPYLIAGGIAVSANPEPIANIVDAVVLGEAEEIIEPMLEILIATMNDKRKRNDRLERLSGIYLPDRNTSAEHITRLHLTELDKFPSVSQIITPYTEFKNMVLIELGRGCPYSCRFCLAGTFYKPVRYRSLHHIYEQIEFARRFSGSGAIPRIGIVATAIADYPQLDQFCAEMLKRKIPVSFASLRADKAPDLLFRLLKQSGQKTIAFAPEAGTETLRTSIGKPLTDNELMEQVYRAVSNGLLNIKLYFMLGLPQETEADIQALIALVRRLRNILISASKPFGRAGKVIVAISPFVPKKGTAFEHERFDDIAELKRKNRLLRSALQKENNLQLQLVNPHTAWLETLLSLGTRETLPALVTDTDKISS
ncbi:MAG: radical SAM protein [bacterium]|nr:radical SAM protein [bacterium]